MEASVVVLPPIEGGKAYLGEKMKVAGYR